MQERQLCPAGTPVHAIGNGIVRYSGKMDGMAGYIIDHPEQDVYSLYGHLSTRKWQRGLGEVRKGECIAYLGEAEEAETMVRISILDCDLVNSDYPRRGRETMDGGLHRFPSGSGRLVPSVGTHWGNRLDEALEALDPEEGGHVVRRNLHVSDFRVRCRMYNEKEDLIRR